MMMNPQPLPPLLQSVNGPYLAVMAQEVNDERTALVEAAEEGDMVRVAAMLCMEQEQGAMGLMTEEVMEEQRRRLIDGRMGEDGLWTPMMAAASTGQVRSLVYAILLNRHGSASPTVL